MGVYTRPIRPDELYHFGVLGMKWGVRRYQNEDGTLTSAGRKRYINGSISFQSGKKKKYTVGASLEFGSKGKNTNNVVNPTSGASNNYSEKKKLTAAQRKQRNRKILKTGAIIAASVLAVYGAHKLVQAHDAEINKWNQVRAMVNKYNNYSFEASVNPTGKAKMSLRNITNEEALRRHKQYMEGMKNFYANTKQGIKANQKHIKIVNRR